jgi:transcriptional regulator with XRE-family HTH domain
MKFVKYLIKKQNELNLSQNKFAEYLGTDKALISLVLSEKRKPSAQFIYKICSKLKDDKLINDFLKERLQ